MVTRGGFPFDAISSETTSRLEIFESLLVRWQRAINLVSNQTIPFIWERHFADSMQIANLGVKGDVWVDFGSGAGFPGLVIAIMFSGDKSKVVHLIESDQKKCTFLREVSRETQVNAIVHCARIEDTLPSLLNKSVEIVTARGLAPLRHLLGYSTPLLERGAIGLFLKGRNVHSEIRSIPTPERFVIELIPSKTEKSSSIVKIGINPSQFWDTRES